MRPGKSLKKGGEPRPPGRELAGKAMIQRLNGRLCSTVPLQRQNSGVMKMAPLWEATGKALASVRCRSQPADFSPTPSKKAFSPPTIPLSVGLNTAIRATAIKPAITAYSMAFAPSSSARNARTLQYTNRVRFFILVCSSNAAITETEPCLHAEARPMMAFCNN